MTNYIPSFAVICNQSSYAMICLFARNVYFRNQKHNILFLISSLISNHTPFLLTCKARVDKGCWYITMICWMKSCTDGWVDLEDYLWLEARIMRRVTNHTGLVVRLCLFSLKRFAIYNNIIYNNISQITIVFSKTIKVNFWKTYGENKKVNVWIIIIIH